MPAPPAARPSPVPTRQPNRYRYFSFVMLLNWGLLLPAHASAPQGVHASAAVCGPAARRCAALHPPLLPRPLRRRLLLLLLLLMILLRRPLLLLPLLLLLLLRLAPLVAEDKGVAVG